MDLKYFNSTPTIALALLIAFSAVLYSLPAKIPLAHGLLGFDTLLGGRVLVKYSCPCSHNSQLFIGPPKSGAFTSNSGTKIYREYHLDVPSWTLGLADEPQLCLEYSTSGPCFPIGPGGPHVRMVGTSK